MPENIQILLEINDYRIQSYRILTDPYPLSSIAFTGYYSDFHHGYLRFEPIVNGRQYQSFYYILELPHLRTGFHQATSRRVYDLGAIRELPLPADRVGITVQILQGEVVNYTLSDPQIEVYGMYIDSTPQPIPSQGVVVVTLKSRYYTDERWLAQFPMRNGQFQVFAIREGSIRYNRQTSSLE